MPETLPENITDNIWYDSQTKILAAALPHATFDGWNAGTLDVAIKDAGIEQSEGLLAFPGGARDLVNFFVAEADRAMLEALDQINLAEMRIRDKISTAIRTRLEQQTQNREAVRQALLFLGVPLEGLVAGRAHLSDAARSLYHTVDAIWYAIGDTSTDFNFYTKRATLSAVYASTLIYWLQDESDDQSATWAFLDRRIEGVMTFERTKGRVREALSRLPTPIDAIKAARRLNPLRPRHGN